MKKRLLACVLSCLLVLHLSVPAFASDVPEEVPISEEDYLLDDDMFVFSEDIHVNPEDYILNSGIMGSSLGATLGLGQIAALIAAGAGAVFASQYLDDLGVHLDNALKAAAASVENGREVYMGWLANAVNGDIALASAPSWIAQTILQTMYGIITTVSPVLGKYDWNGYPTVVSGELVPAGTSFYVGGLDVDSNGNAYRSSSNRYSFDFDCVVFRFCNYQDLSTMYTEIEDYAVVFKLSSGSSGNMTYGTSTSAWSPNYYYTSKTTGATRYYKKIGISGQVYDNPKLYEAYKNFVLPGAYECADPWNYMVGYAQTMFDHYLAGDVIDGLGAVPDGDPVSPDVLIGGLPEVWVGQGLGADVITFPDIMVDGTGVIAPDTTLEGEAAWDVAIDGALEDLKTGELSWSDYWLDISDSVPVAKVEDETTGDIVDRPIGDDGSLKDPVVVPDYSTDLEDYKLDLKGIFPFCIPFDIYNFLSCLAAEPVAPSWDWKLVVPFTDGDYSITVDLSPFDSVAVVFRNFELLIFIVGLGIKTRDIIKG